MPLNFRHCQAVSFTRMGGGQSELRKSYLQRLLGALLLLFIRELVQYHAVSHTNPTHNERVKQVLLAPLSSFRDNLHKVTLLMTKVYAAVSLYYMSLSSKLPFHLSKDFQADIIILSPTPVYSKGNVTVKVATCIYVRWAMTSHYSSSLSIFRKSLLTNQ